MSRKAILILGGSNDQLVLINTAHKMSLLTVVVDGNKEAIGLKIASYSKAIDFSDTKAVISYIEQLITEGVNVKGVLTMGSDVPHLIAQIADHFSWVAPSAKVAQITTDKFLMKERFKSHDIATPEYASISSVEEIKQYWQLWSCQHIIIKPVDAAGSRGVSICNQNSDIDKLYQHAINNSRSNRVIIEEYIEGEQISTESIVYQSQCYHPGFADRVYEDTKNFYPYIMENGGWQPSRIHGKKYTEICLLIESIVKALAFKNGVIKGDIVYSPKYNKAMVIEVASRLSGGDFSASLVPLAHGINYIKTAIQIALNEDIDLTELTAKSNFIVANRYFFIPPGQLNTINGIKEIQKIEQIKKIEFNYELNAMIPTIRNHGQRVGVFIVQGESYEQVQSIIDDVYNKISFTVNNKIYSGHPKHYEI